MVVICVFNILDWDKYKIDADDRTEEQEGDPHTDEQLLDPEDPNFVVRVSVISIWYWLLE